MCITKVSTIGGEFQYLNKEGIMMKQSIFLTLMLFVFSYPLHAAETTGKGKIVFTQGHTGASCRTVAHKENETGVQRYFRIADVASDDNVAAIVLSALMANRDTTITFEPGQTTGCGTEPKIIYITVF